MSQGPGAAVGFARPHPARGFHGPGSRMWRINREAVLLGAGPAALLLQIAHPLVAEGVAQHSHFEADPFGRLRRTLATTMDIVFGDGPAAQRAVRRLNGVHGGVRGPVADPAARRASGVTTYRALDPALLLWVQATLIVTSVRAYERWVGALTGPDREGFWEEARTVGTALGIPASVAPPDWASLEGYWERMLAEDGPIQVTPTALALAPGILRPPIPMLPGALIDLAGLPGLALLPPRLRDAYGIAWGPGREHAAALLARSLRLWVRVVPASWRAMPQARAAERRLRRPPSRRGQGRRPLISRRQTARRTRSADVSATIPGTIEQEPSPRA